MNKKFTSLLMALVMCLSLAIPAIATNTSSGDSAQTDVVYEGQDGGPTGGATWTVTVPASLQPGGSAGEVYVEGSWGDGYTLDVTAADAGGTNAANKVTMTNEDGSSTKELAVNFDGISCAGNNGVAITKDTTGAKTNIDVAAMTGVNFGEWNGQINFTIGLNPVA